MPNLSLSFVDKVTRIAGVVAFAGAVAIAISPFTTAVILTVAGDPAQDWRAVSFLELGRMYGLLLFTLSLICIALIALSVRSMSGRLDVSLVLATIITLSVVILANTFASEDAIRSILGEGGDGRTMQPLVERHPGSQLVAPVNGVRRGEFHWVSIAAVSLLTIGTACEVWTRRISRRLRT